MRRPDANAFHLRQVLDDFVVRKVGEGRKIQLARLCFCRQVTQIRKLLFGEPGSAHLFRGQLQNSLRRQRRPR